MNRTHKLLVLLSLPLFLVAATAAPSFFHTPAALCFTSGSATYQLAPTAVAPDYRIRIDNGAAHPDLRMQPVDRPEIADFVLADDFGFRGQDACRAAFTLKTVKVVGEGETPDVTVALTSASGMADHRIYVHSGRFSYQDAAALLAALWKASERRRLAGAEPSVELDGSR